MTDVSGRVGVKFDLVELVDLDGDGDLDAITCEEVDNLGVFWFENPLYDSSKLHRTTSDWTVYIKWLRLMKTQQLRKLLLHSNENVVVL